MNRLGVVIGFAAGCALPWIIVGIVSFIFWSLPSDISIITVRGTIVAGLIGAFVGGIE